MFFRSLTLLDNDGTEKHTYLKAFEKEKLDKQTINQNLIELAQSLQKNYSNTSNVIMQDLEVFYTIKITIFIS